MVKSTKRDTTAARAAARLVHRQRKHDRLARELGQAPAEEFGPDARAAITDLARRLSDGL